jgi:hypothetical protein
VKRRQIIGQLVVGAGIVALLAACGSNANATRVGGIPTTVIGATGGQIVFSPTQVPSTATRRATVTRTVAATPVASPTR